MAGDGQGRRVRSVGQRKRLSLIDFQFLFSSQNPTGEPVTLTGEAELASPHPPVTAGEHRLPPPLLPQEKKPTKTTSLCHGPPPPLLINSARTCLGKRTSWASLVSRWGKVGDPPPAHAGQGDERAGWWEGGKAAGGGGVRFWPPRPLC